MRRFFALASLAVLVAASTAGAEPLQQPDVYVPATEVEQSGAVLIVVKNEVSMPSGSLGKVRLTFFRSENDKDWVALVGIPFNKSPGNYELLVKTPGKADVKKNIAIAKRSYPETQMVVTPDLQKKGFTQKKIINNIISENKDLGKAFIFFTKNVYSPKPFTYPLSEMKTTGDFGDIRGGVRHLGTDLKAPVGTPVYAVNDGRVVLAKKYINYGNTLVVHHGLGVYSMYLHLSEFNASRGQVVKQGDIIGLAGDSGYAIGPHLHFSMKVRGATVDPLKFIQASQQYGTN